MLEHVVLIAWKPEASPDAIEKVAVESQRLETIEGVISASFQRELQLAKPEYRRDFQHVLVVKMRDEDTLRRFGPDPVHRAFAEVFFPLVREVVIVDHLTDPER